MQLATPSHAQGEVFATTTLVRGQPAQIACVRISGQLFQLDRGPVSTLHLEDEWFADIADPQRVIDELAAHPALSPDLFSFWQRLPDCQARHAYHLEWEELAAIPVSSYEDWWANGIKSKVRGEIKRALREGLVVKEVPFDDDFVRGITAIFNESPVRQGRPFWHFGKDFETVKAQFSRYVHREIMIGAYLGEELIGFIMLSNAGRFALTCQIISSIRHREHSPNAALIAKAVEICAREKLGHLVYFHWGDGTLAAFKRRCGFQKISVPRYYVPLSWKGSVALRLGLHHGLKAWIPAPLMQRLKAWRSAWYQRPRG